MRRIVKDVVLGLAGLAGLGAIVWLIASAAFGTQLMIFRTGSMAPTMPTGAAAVTVPVAPDAIRVGDVVTVQRPGAALPVTHRVVSTAADPGHPDARILVLKGDANRIADAQPYTVSEARRVVVAVPGLGSALLVARTPVVVGATTIGVAALVVWAFWPAPAGAARRRDDEEADAEGVDADAPELVGVSR
jgi:signal peptidase I